MNLAARALDTLARFADGWRLPAAAVGLWLVAGLAMRCSWRLRTHAGMATLGVGVLAVLGGPWAAGVLLLGLATFSYVRLAEAVRRPGRWPLAVAGLAVLVAGFLAPEVAGPPPGGVILLDMLVLIRLAVFVWEFGAGRFDRPTAVEFVAWFALPFANGNPVLRYSEFRRQQPWKVVPLPPVGPGWWADVAVRAGMVAASGGLAVAAAELDRRGWPGKLVNTFGPGPWGWYLGAAAAAGLARRAGALGGLDIPANFASPFGSRNLSLFWSRWNITVTNAFRDIIFYNRWGLPHPNLYLNTMIVFLAVGVWHAANPYWALFGFLHGLGFLFLHSVAEVAGAGRPAAPGRCRVGPHLCVRLLVLGRPVADFKSAAGRRLNPEESPDESADHRDPRPGRDRHGVQAVPRASRRPGPDGQPAGLGLARPHGPGDRPGKGIRGPVRRVHPPRTGVRRRHRPGTGQTQGRLTPGGPVTHAVELPDPMPAELASDFLGKLHYVSEDLAGFTLAGNTVQFETRPGREASADTIAARIREMAAKMTAGHRGFVPRVLAARRPAGTAYRDNPRAQLEADGNLFEYGPGRFGLGPALVRLEEYFEAGLLRLADQLGAARHRFPALVGVDVLNRCRYIQSFPQALTLASHLREDLDAIQRFAAGVGPADATVTPPPGAVAASECLLAPTVCFHYYAWLRDRTLDAPRTITALGHCFRYEAGAMTTLERLWDFTMREVVFVGPPAFVLVQRDRCIELTVGLLDEWGLGYEIKTATDPFFIEGYTAQVAFQSTFELKFEIRADLPYAPGKSLAVGSFNFHQDFFGRSLGITGPGGDGPATTGCVGFGVERLAWAFLCQHGPDPAGWPAPARAAVAGGVTG